MSTTGTTLRVASRLSMSGRSWAGLAPHNVEARQSHDIGTAFRNARHCADRLGVGAARGRALGIIGTNTVEGNTTETHYVKGRYHLSGSGSGRSAGQRVAGIPPDRHRAQVGRLSQRGGSG